MAILLTMIATIFLQATQAFRVARATIEIHRNATAVLNVFENDLTASGFTPYGTGLQVIFAAVAPYTDPNTGNPSPYAALTFTTLAPQPGAANAAPEAVLQLRARSIRSRMGRRQRDSAGDARAAADLSSHEARGLSECRHSRPELRHFQFNRFQPEPVAFSVLSMHVRLYDTFMQTGARTGPSTQWLHGPPTMRLCLAMSPPTLRTNPGPPALVETAGVATRPRFWLQAEAHLRKRCQPRLSAGQPAGGTGGQAGLPARWRARARHARAHGRGKCPSAACDFSRGRRQEVIANCHGPLDSDWRRGTLETVSASRNTVQVRGCPATVSGEATHSGPRRPLPRPIAVGRP